MKRAIIVALALVPAAAHADQCQWLEDPAVATRAVRELSSKPEVVTFCEPCGDVAPGAPRVVSSAAIQRVDGRAVTLMIDGQPVDLAYVYVKTSAQQYRNLAVLAGCPTTGVSPSLRVDTATSDGVLIHAEHAPARELRVPGSEPALERAPAIAPTIVVVAAEPALWLAALLGLAVPLVLLASLALYFAARRRPGHEPRASRLTPP